MLKFVPAAVALALSLAGCAHAPPGAAPAPPSAPQAAVPVSAGPAADDNLNAVAWTQNASEHDFIYMQTYRNAQEKLLKAKSDPTWDALPKDDRRRMPPSRA